MGGVIKECLHAGQVKFPVVPLLWTNLRSCSCKCNKFFNRIKWSHPNCYGKTGSGNLVGSTAAVPSTGGLLTDAQMKDSSSYQGWSFGADWKMSDDGIPARTDSSDIHFTFCKIYSVLLLYW